jgi:hypothetical protein
MRTTMLVSLALAGGIAVQALAQSQPDLQVLRKLDDAKVVAPDGTELGAIEQVLLDDTGTPVALGVDVRDEYLETGDGRVFLLDDLGWQDGNYVSSLTAAAIEGLPAYDE